MEPIQVVGIKELSDAEKSTLNELSNDYYKRLTARLNNAISLVLQVKATAKGGKKRYSITARIKGPGPVFESSAEDWDFPKTIHMVMEELESQIKHRLKTDAKKPRGAPKSERY